MGANELVPTSWGLIEQTGKPSGEDTQPQLRGGHREGVSVHAASFSAGCSRVFS